jgi:hypothetical protein
VAWSDSGLGAMPVFSPKWAAGLPLRGPQRDDLEAAGCLEHDQVGFQHLEPRDEVLEPGASDGTAK